MADITHYVVRLDGSGAKEPVELGSVDAVPDTAGFLHVEKHRVGEAPHHLGASTILVNNTARTVSRKSSGSGAAYGFQNLSSTTEFLLVERKTMS